MMRYAGGFESHMHSEYAGFTRRWTYKIPVATCVWSHTPNSLNFVAPKDFHKQTPGNTQRCAHRTSMHYGNEANSMCVCVCVCVSVCAACGGISERIEFV